MRAVDGHVKESSCENEEQGKTELALATSGKFCMSMRLSSPAHLNYLTTRSGLCRLLPITSIHPEIRRRIHVVLCYLHSNRHYQTRRLLRGHTSMLDGAGNNIPVRSAQCQNRWLLFLRRGTCTPPTILSRTKTTHSNNSKLCFVP